jgi:hypothetical protein
LTESSPRLPYFIVGSEAFILTEDSVMTSSFGDFANTLIQEALRKAVEDISPLLSEPELRAEVQRLFSALTLEEASAIYEEAVS